MRTSPIVALVVATGCKSLFGLDDPLPLEEQGDASTSTADARLCWGVEIDVCLPAAPTSAVELTGTLDTTSDARCQSIAGHCVIAGTTVAVTANLAVTGGKPLVVIGLQTVTIGGVLDAASHRGGASGPGAATAPCGTFTVAPSYVDETATGGGAGGGAGGSLVALGGAGGGNDDGPGSIPEAMGGQPVAAPAMPVFRAGCPGQRGGHKQPIMGVAGGSGGGAVYVAAGTRIDIAAAGAINASGAGGTHGSCGPCATGNTAAELAAAAAHGASGGGSGGMIVLDAPAIANAGRVFADGGGGGEGASRTNIGNDGADPTGTGAAPGGANGNGNGGDGGAGAHEQLAVGAGALGISAHPGGGGGGGGGRGVVIVHGTLSGGGLVSPSPG